MRSPSAAARQEFWSPSGLRAANRSILQLLIDCVVVAPGGGAFGAWEKGRYRHSLPGRLEPIWRRCPARRFAALSPHGVVGSPAGPRRLGGGAIRSVMLIVLASVLLLLPTARAFAENERQNERVLVIGVGDPGSSSYRIGVWLTSLLRAGALPDHSQTRIELWESLSPAERAVVLLEETQLAVIPAGEAQLQKPKVRQHVRATISLADGNQVLVRADLSDEFVYELTRLMFKHSDPTRYIYCPELSTLDPVGSLMRIQGAAHPGALRFYREHLGAPELAVGLQETGRTPDTGLGETASASPEAEHGVSKAAGALPETAGALPEGLAWRLPEPAPLMPEAVAPASQTAAAPTKTAGALLETGLTPPETGLGLPETALPLPNTAFALPDTAVVLPTDDRPVPDLSRAVLSTNLSFGSEPEDNGPLRHRLELESSLGGSVLFGNARREGHGQLRLNERVSLADIASLETKASFLDVRRKPEKHEFDREELYKEFRFLDSPAEQEVNRVGDATVSLGLLGNRIRLTSRLASSTYGRSDFRPKRPKRRPDDHDDGDGKKRFQNRSGADGSARLQRLDMSVWRAGDTEVTLFGEYGEVGRYFESLALEDDDPFATPNRERTSFGAILKQGPLQLTFAQTSSREASSEADNTEVQYEVGASADLDQVSKDLGLDISHPLWLLAPSSVWLKSAQGRVEADAGGDEPDDRVRDFSAGLTWSADHHYVDASYWQSIYDDEVPYGEQYDWVGRGGDLSFGVFGDRWGLDLSLTADGAENLAPSSRTSAYGYDGSITLWLRPEKLPGISIGLNVGRYDVDYQAYGGSNATDNWGIETIAVLSKYLWGERPGSEPQLKLLYRFDNSRSRGEFSDGGDRMEHVPAVWYSLKF